MGWRAVLPELPRGLFRHWRGDLPLPISFWALGTLSKLVIVTLQSAIECALRVFSEFYLILACQLLQDSAIAIILVWWCVGTWRSANQRSRQKRSSWSKIAKGAVAFVFLVNTYSIISRTKSEIFEVVQIAADDPEWGDRGVRVIRHGTGIEIYGGISRSVSSDFAHAVSVSPGISFVELSGPGGRGFFAEKIADDIKAKRLDTLVSKKCASACAVVFLAGRHRFMAKSAQLGFHSATSIGEKDASTNKLIREQMAAQGIAPSFIEKVFSTPSNAMWYPTFDELVEAGVVTDLAPDTPDEQ
jgi:hypothetical protein